VLAAKTEPWGCPANIVRGPILIATTSDQTYTIADCVFFACTANNSSGKRTSNFGLGMLSPWSADGWNTQVSGLVMQSPLSYNTAYPFAELHYAAAHLLHAGDGRLTFNSDSRLVLYQTQPPGYTCLNIIADLPWMSVVPQSMTIDGTLTGWPGTSQSAIAMVDSGGGPVFLSDPYGYVYDKPWPGPVTCPSWASGSTNCNCTSTSIGLTLSDGVTSYSYTIDTASMPPSVRGLTGVLCQENSFLHGYYGMNIGGISNLFNDVLINYSAPQVGFKPR
jgi:hypothetical protein